MGVRQASPIISC